MSRDFEVGDRVWVTSKHFTSDQYTGRLRGLRGTVVKHQHPQDAYGVLVLLDGQKRALCWSRERVTKLSLIDLIAEV
jgi:ribosomal protein L21E